MSREPLPHGPYEGRVVDNVRALRAGRHFATLHELEQRLTAQGWPISSLGLSRMLAGQRRVTVDDAVALAYALGVEPVDLIFRNVSVGLVVTVDDSEVLTDGR